MSEWKIASVKPGPNGTLFVEVDARDDAEDAPFASTTFSVTPSETPDAVAEHCAAVWRQLDRQRRDAHLSCLLAKELAGRTGTVEPAATTDREKAARAEAAAIALEKADAAAAEAQAIANRAADEAAKAAK